MNGELRIKFTQLVLLNTQGWYNANGVYAMTRDLRKYARQTNLHLLIGFFLLLFVVGDGLIWIIYGKGAALMGITCLLLGMIPLVLIGLVMWILDFFVKRANQD